MMSDAGQTPFLGVYQTESGEHVDMASGLVVSKSDIKPNMKPFYGVFLDANGQKHELKDLAVSGGGEGGGGNYDNAIQLLQNQINEVKATVAGINNISPVTIAAIQTRLTLLETTVSDINDVSSTTIPAIQTQLSTLEAMIGDINNIPPDTITKIQNAVTNMQNAITEQGALLANKVDTSSLASQSQAESGTNNTTWMSPLRVKQALAKLSSSDAIKSFRIGEMSRSSWYYPPYMWLSLDYDNYPEDALQHLVLNGSFPEGKIGVDVLQLNEILTEGYESGLNQMIDELWNVEEIIFSLLIPPQYSNQTLQIAFQISPGYTYNGGFVMSNDRQSGDIQSLEEELLLYDGLVPREGAWHCSVRLKPETEFGRCIVETMVISSSSDSSWAPRLWTNRGMFFWNIYGESSYPFPNFSFGTFQTPFPPATRLLSSVILKEGTYNYG